MYRIEVINWVVIAIAAFLRLGRAKTLGAFVSDALKASPFAWRRLPTQHQTITC